MNYRSLLAAAVATVAVSQPVSALNIILTNDDGWDTDNIQALFGALENAGHDVILSAPCTGQSGTGGAIRFVEPVSIDDSQIAQDQACVGDTDETVPYEDFVPGTPVMAALYGIDVLAINKWGTQPDLVISGPNEGNNLGYLTNNSGTLGAANIAIARGLPAIAVSAATSDADTAEAVADVVVEMVAELEAQQTEGQALLPLYTGLNVNFPEDVINSPGIRFTDVGWYAGFDVVFSADLSQNDDILGFVAQGIIEAGVTDDFNVALEIARSQFAGQAGISVDQDSVSQDTNENSEGRAIEQGYITVSTIEANVQASRAKTALTRIRLNGLVD